MSLSINLEGGYAINFIVFTILFLLTPDILWLHAYKFMIPFFVMGYYYAKRHASWLESNLIGVFSFIVWAILMMFYTKESYIYTTGITLLGKENLMNQVVIDGYRYVVGAFGVAAMVWFLKKIYTAFSLYDVSLLVSLEKMIEYMGRNSIIYYILSTYLFAWILPYTTNNFTFNLGLVFIETAVVAALCDILGRIIKRFKMAAKWLIAS